MIYYFSGTGNSFHAANRLAAGFNDQVYAMAKGNPAPRTLLSGERLGFVFPIHAWAPPKFVRDFIAHLVIDGTAPSVYYVAVCGAEEGDTRHLFERLMHRKGWQLIGGYTLVMPNNYMLGYELESKEEQTVMLKAADERLDVLTTQIQKDHFAFDTVPGKGAWLKTQFINPMFRRFAMRTGPFVATDKCIRCGLCVTICPVHTITMNDLPVWGKACTQCLACINRCPVEAIEYGKATIGKARYHHPDLN
jgi:NAD-dependent dihydropyrimidine dehydrogenase PreA subunit